MSGSCVNIGADVSFAQQMVEKALARMPEELSAGRPWGPWKATVEPDPSDPLRTDVTLNIDLVGGGKKITARCLLERVNAEAEWELGFCAITVGRERESYDFYGSLQDNGSGLYLGVYTVCIGCGDPELTRDVHNLDWVANDTDLVNKATWCDIPPLPDEDGAFVVNPWARGMRLTVNQGCLSVVIGGEPGNLRLVYTNREGGGKTGFTIDFPSGGRPARFVEFLPTAQGVSKEDIQQATRLLKQVLSQEEGS